MQRKVQLRRTLGLFEVTLSGIGVILGAGIYALIGEAAGLAGNAVWISFALSAVVAVFTGLSYAELASMFPKASAEYEYTSQAFGPFPAFVIGWLIIFSGVIGAATVSLGFAGYFQALTGAPLLPSALILLAVLSAVVSVGVKAVGPGGCHLHSYRSLGTRIGNTIGNSIPGQSKPAGDVASGLFRHIPGVRPDILRLHRL